MRQTEVDHVAACLLLAWIDEREKSGCETFIYDKDEELGLAGCGWTDCIECPIMELCYHNNNDKSRRHRWRSFKYHAGKV